jgi:hypothetical protein
MLLSYTDTNTISKWTETRIHITKVTKEFHRVCPKWFLSLWYVWCKSCTNLASRLALSPNGLIWAPTFASSPRSTIGCAHNYFSEPMVRLAKTKHLSCPDNNTVSKWTEMRFYMTHVSKKFHRAHQKWLLSRWYVRRKPCIHLASRLAISPNGLNRPSTWASSPSSINGCVQNYFWGYGTFCANRAPIFHWH